MTVICCIGLFAFLSAPNADESVAAPPMVAITLAPISSEVMWSRLGAEIAYVDLLPDGRIAVLGGRPRGPDGYLRLIDMKSGQETYYYLPNSDDLGGTDNGWADVAVLEGAVFIYSDGSRLRRGTIDLRSATGSSVFPNSDVELNRGSGGGAAPGAMVADYNSLLVGWGGLGDSDEGDDCGTGPVVVRLSSDGTEIWRWNDSTEKFAFPNEIVVLSNGTILALVEGDTRRWIERGWNSCPSDLKYLLVLSPDGREIARANLPSDMSLTPMVLSGNGTEVLAAGVTFDGNLSAILHIRVQAGRIQIERDNLADKMSGINPHDVLVASLDSEGYRLITFSGAVVTLDRQGHVVDRNFPIIGGQRCSLSSGLGLVCW